MREFPSKSWTKRSLNRLLKNRGTLAQLTDVQVAAGAPFRYLNFEYIKSIVHCSV